MQSPATAFSSTFPCSGTRNLKICSPVCSASFLPSAYRVTDVLVGVDLDLDLLLGAVGEPLGADVDEVLLAPPCFIEVKAVLFGLAVKGHQTLVVHARLAALIPGVCCKVEHVPDMGRPQPRVAVKALQHILVVLGLILLGVVAPAGVGTVEVGHALGTVLGKAQRTVGVYQMEKVHPQVIQKQPRHIPAQIQVPADQVGDVRHRVEGAAHGVAGQAWSGGWGPSRGTAR